MATVEQTYLKVQRILTGPMGLRIQVNGEWMSVQFQETSTSVRLKIFPYAKDDDGEPLSLVYIQSLILRDVRPTAALFEWVAREGGANWFGHVVVRDAEEAGSVVLLAEHTLLGDYLDEQELAAAMYGVLGFADHYDEELQKRFGGKRWVDE